MTRQDLLPLAHLALSAVFLLWNIILAGRITRQRSLPPILGGLTALGGLLIAPAFLISVAGASLLTGRSLHSIAWVWPVTAALIAAQAFYATATRLVTPIVGIPILLYDIAATAAALGTYLLSQGEELSMPMATLVAASGNALVRVVGPQALMEPMHAMIPILAPAHPSRWRLIAGWRVAVAAAALAWVVLMVGSFRPASISITSYAAMKSYELRPRPGEPFALGLEILPSLNYPPPRVHLRADLDLMGSAALDAVMVDIPAEGARMAALDSLRRALDPFRRDSLLLIAAIQPKGPGGPMTGAADSAHLALIEQVARRLTPDYLLPFDDPEPQPVRTLDPQWVSRRIEQLDAAATVARRINPRIKVGISIVPGSARDSALYAWAVSGASSVAAVGFTILADGGGGSTVESRLDAAKRLMETAATPKEHWVFHAGALPNLHGERAQELVLAAVLGWAMGQPGVRGAIVTRAGDYADQRGLRAPSGRLRSAVAVLQKASREIR
jgi:hypothetical protein